MCQGLHVEAFEDAEVVRGQILAAGNCLTRMSRGGSGLGPPIYSTQPQCGVIMVKTSGRVDAAIQGAACLHGAVGSHQLVFEVGGPQAQARQVHEQVLVDHRELPAQHAAHVDVAGVGLEALVVAQDLQARAGLRRAGATLDGGPTRAQACVNAVGLGRMTRVGLSQHDWTRLHRTPAQQGTDPAAVTTTQERCAQTRLWWLHAGCGGAACKPARLVRHIQPATAPVDRTQPPETGTSFCPYVCIISWNAPLTRPASKAAVTGPDRRLRPDRGHQAA